MSYIKNVLIAIDQTINTIFNGWPDETFSSRCWRWSKDGKRDWPRKLVDGILFWDKNHCRESYESEREGRQLPPELRVKVHSVTSR